MRNVILLMTIWYLSYSTSSQSLIYESQDNKPYLVSLTDNMKEKVKKGNFNFYEKITGFIFQFTSHFKNIRTVVILAGAPLLFNALT